jgi:HD-GYP domain-containing protein (c-di-GMP phosphodiesterase class II)
MVRICDGAGRATGLVAVSRDETDLVEQRRRHGRLLRATVDALVRAIELRDPHLVGHTRRLRRYAVAVARRLGMGEREVATVDLAACLSQVGKIFLPDGLLTKPGRLSTAETTTLRRHVEHALKVVGPIDFGLPVRDALGHMYERLDGSGYPNGLRGAAIAPTARVLGVVDAFCALTTTRSHRPSSSAGNALLRLAGQAASYDVRVVAALAEVVATEGGDAAPAGAPEAAA